MKKIKFRSKLVTVEDARKMLVELANALSEADPVVTDSPVGHPMLALEDPRWYSDIAPHSVGTLLSFRDPGIGWRAFIIPWGGVAEIIKLLSAQMSAVIESSKSSSPTQIH